VIVVEQDREDAHAFLRRLALFIVHRPNRRERARERDVIATEIAGALDRHPRAVIPQLEIVRREIGNRLAALVGDDRVDLDQVRPRSKRGRLLNGERAAERKTQRAHTKLRAGIPMLPSERSAL
jgi:hypothetical protein